MLRDGFSALRDVEVNAGIVGIGRSLKIFGTGRGRHKCNTNETLVYKGVV